MQHSATFTTSLFVDEGPALISGRGAELEEGLGSLGFQAGEETTVRIGADREELRASLWSRLPSHRWVTHRGSMDVIHCYPDPHTHNRLFAPADLS